jgi:hypothetical protein
MSEFKGQWRESVISVSTDAYNSAEVDLLGEFEAVEIDIPTITSSQLQIKAANDTGDTFDLIGDDEPVGASTGGFRVTLSLGGKYRFVKVYCSVAQEADRTFYVRGVGDTAAGIMNLYGKFASLASKLDTIDASLADIESDIETLNNSFNACGDVYRNTATMANDNATRFETSEYKLRYAKISVTTNDIKFGDSSTQDFIVAADTSVELAMFDLSTLYFKNSSAGQNGTVNIIGIEL